MQLHAITQREGRVRYGKNHGQFTIYGRSVLCMRFMVPLELVCGISIPSRHNLESKVHESFAHSQPLLEDFSQPYWIRAP